ncbi:phosphatase PAP2 family protein [Xylophilus sp. GOD-11R]|uniref:acid phosphatase n=1 Tax=Xylophilus sp. GOD-11R TaxID=3089814 RepID=UPI00298C20C2|nr:phosphatase PAP2 family protein [Xylophilus sp. GOD-11R]WPB57304.1 phosphatase PAP2 family protein [Xylophilus sp. GOD-11R]
MAFKMPPGLCRPRTASVLAAVLLTACAAPQPPLDPAVIGEVWPGYGILKGYLPPAQLPDSLALLPRPPAEGSPGFEDDRASFFALTALQSTPRGPLALRDADLTSPNAAQAFSCALGLPIDARQTPHLAMLLRRTLGDASLAPYAAKNAWRRARPFTVLRTPSCVPAEEAGLASDGSYPSGHASAGWAWALVLAEIAPDRADALLQRGRAFSQSRAICGVHWKSDIEAGRLVGAATVARLHAEPVFLAQLAAARQEVVVARQNPPAPVADCTAEAAALESTRELAP